MQAMLHLLDRRMHLRPHLRLAERDRGRGVGGKLDLRESPERSSARRVGEIQRHDIVGKQFMTGPDQRACGRRFAGALVAHEDGAFAGHRDGAGMQDEQATPVQQQRHHRPEQREGKQGVVDAGRRLDVDAADIADQEGADGMPCQILPVRLEAEDRSRPPARV